MVSMPDHAGIVVGVAGRIGSGKTLVAQELAASFGFEYFRYSLVLAEWHGVDPQNKGELQEIGGRVMSGEGQLELNRRLISRISPGKDSVIDGLRHPLDFASLDKEFGRSFSLIFVEATPEIRFERLRDRFSDFDHFLEADDRPVECRIDELKQLSTEVLPGTLERTQLQVRLKSLVVAFRQKAES